MTTSQSTQAELRFNIASMMCATSAVAVMLAYLKMFEPQEFVRGLQIVALVSLAGLIVGLAAHRAVEAAFWSVMGAMSAFLCAVGEPLTHELFQYAWPLVGALTAASAILLDRYSWAIRMLVGAIVGGVVLAVFALLPSQFGAHNVWTEVVCGPVAGAIMVGVVWILETLRTWKRYSRSMLVLSLTIGVIGGNVLGRWIGVL